MTEVRSYPFKLPKFGDGYQTVLLENDYFLEYGKRQISEGIFELYAVIKSRYYPHAPVGVDGLKENIQIYTIGGEPSATWENINGKIIYLFLSNTTTYVSDQRTLGPTEQGGFDSSEVDTSIGIIQNHDNLYDIVSECGAYFNPYISYRKFSFVKSSYNGRLYIKFTDGITEAGADQKDPSKDTVNWKLLIIDRESEENNKVNVDLTSNQLVGGIKTFKSPYKETNNPKLNALELITLQEAKERFLGIEDPATNALQLDRCKASDTFESNKQVIVKTSNDGKISDSFLNAPIISSERVIKVDAGKANGIDVFATIQEAFNAVSKMIRVAPITISVSDNTYFDDAGTAPVLNLTNIYDCSNISIIGNVERPENCIIRINQSQQGIFFSGKGLYINGFKIVQSSGDKGRSIGINLDYGASIIFGKSMIVENCKYGVYASNLTFANCEYMQAINCDIAYYADNATLNLDNSKTQSCITSYKAENNSVIYANSVIIDKGSQIQSTIGFEATYGSIIRAKNTVGSTNSADNQYSGMETNTPNSTNGIIEYT